jgi:hypothetical protein
MKIRFSGLYRPRPKPANAAKYALDLGGWAVDEVSGLQARLKLALSTDLLGGIIACTS